MQPVKIEILLNDKMSPAVRVIETEVDKLVGRTRKANKEIDETGKVAERAKRALGQLASAFAIKELVGNVTKVRGEFQQLEVAFTTMLGSAERADGLMKELVKTAATTPFGLEDVAGGAKQLLAYGLEAEKVNETLIRLGDIAAGLSVGLNDLVYLYGTTMAQGRLYTQDLNQFTGRGIPMLKELAKQFGVAESEVKSLVEAGKVGFPEVQKVIESLTDEGGTFGGLMEAQSRTITGQISNIEDAMTSMLNEIGEQSEGVINASLQGVSWIVEHYERVGRVLLGLVGTYGVYRAAVMTVAAAQGWATSAEALHYNWLVVVERAQKLLNATMLSNPYVLVATLIYRATMCKRETMQNDSETQNKILRIESHKRQIEAMRKKLDEHKKNIENIEKKRENEKRTKTSI